MKNKKWLVFIAIVLILGVSALAGVVLYLRSEAGSRMVLTRATAYLRDNQGMRLEFAEGRLDPLRGLHFRNLSVHREVSGQTFQAKIERLDIDYLISYFPLKLEIERIEIIKPKIHLKMNPSPSSEEPPEPASESNSLDELVKNPPLQLVLKRFRLEQLDCEFESGGTRARLAPVDAEMRFEMVKNRLLGSGELKALGANEISLPGLALSPSAQGKWDLGVQLENGQWMYRIDPAEFSMSMRDLRLDNRQAMKEATAKLRLDLKAKSTKLFQFAQDSVEVVNANLEADASSFKMPPWTIGSQNLRLRTQLGREIELVTDYKADDINSPEVFSRPSDMTLHATAKIPRDLRSVATKADLALQGIPLVSIDGQVAMTADEAIEFATQLALKLKPELAAIVKPAATLKKAGPIAADLTLKGRRQKSGAIEAQVKAVVPEFKFQEIPGMTSVDLDLNTSWLPASSKFKAEGQTAIKNSSYGHWQAQVSQEAATLPAPNGSGRILLTEVAPAKPGVLPVSFSQPIAIENRFDLGKGVAELNASLPSTRAPGYARLKDTRLEVTITSPDLAAAKNADLQLQLKQGAIELEKPYADQAPPLDGLELKLRAGLRNGVDFTVEEFIADLNRAMLVVSAQASGDLKTKSLQAQTKISLKVPEKFPALAGQDLRGRVEIPATITVQSGRDVGITGDLVALGLSWSKGAIGLEGITGRLPFSESLKWDGQSLRFTRLVQQNPFERVDFERVRPLLRDAQLFRIQRLRWEDKTYGPMVGFFSLEQNMISAHQFDLDFGSGPDAGQLSGELFFDAHPANLQLGLLARMTGIDLARVLPAKFLARAPSGEKNISGRSGFVVNLNRGTMDGRVDITEIGGGQLIALINVLDPLYEDEKLNKVRGLLQVGYPTAVGLAFSDGYLDLDLTLALLGLTQRQSVNGIPISSLLSSATADIVKQTGKGPLK